MVSGYIASSIKEPFKRSRLSGLSAGTLFSLGVIIPFTAIGLLFAVIGSGIKIIFPQFILLMAILLVVWGILHLLGVELPLPSLQLRGVEGRHSRDLFINGAIYGLGTSDCAVMIAAPVFFLSLGTPYSSVALFNFLFFGLGRSTPIIVAAQLLDAAQKRFIGFFVTKGRILNRLSSGLIVSAGLLLALFSQI